MKELALQDTNKGPNSNYQQLSYALMEGTKTINCSHCYKLLSKRAFNRFRHEENCPKSPWNYKFATTKSGSFFCYFGCAEVY